jgi:hypothetical protein
MKNIIPILLLYLPLTLLAQNSSEKAGVRERIETAVEQGLITREQADERYSEFRKRMNLNKREQNTELEKHYNKLGVNNLDRIKKGLLNNGITDNQLDAVLRGMIRLIHGAKADGNNFEMNPRMQIYFQDRIGLNQEQVQHVMDSSVRIAQRVR